MPQQMDDELLQQAQAGEESAIAALITAMMPAIRKGAAAVAAPGLDFDDAVQEGLIGLFHAVRSYRADKKNRAFSSFQGDFHLCTIILT